MVIGITFNAALTLTAQINADNTVQFSLSNVSLTSSSPFFPPGYLEFTAGSLIVDRIEVSACPTCAADFNRDDGVDDLDITDFFAAFEQGDPCADVNNDDGIDDLDITDFFLAFEQGC